MNYDLNLNLKCSRDEDLMETTGRNLAYVWIVRFMTKGSQFHYPPPIYQYILYWSLFTSLN